MPGKSTKKAQLMGFGQGEWQVRHKTSAHYEYTSLHHHDSYEFYLHIRNGGLIQLDQQVMPLMPYQLIVIPPHHAHGLVQLAPVKDYERLYVQVSPAVLDGLFSADLSARKILDQVCRQGVKTVQISTQEYLHLHSLAMDILPCEMVSTPLERMEALGYLSALVSRICQLLTATQRKENQPFAPLMQAVYHHITDHFAQDCSLEALAAEFSINKYHLSRRFSETFGIGLHQFVLECRIAHAQQLIRQGEPLMTVFYRCGFNDYSSFVRAFSRTTGASPRAWRKQQMASAM